MATYFHGNSEIEGDEGLQTLILMNPSYVGYSSTEAQPPGNFSFLNSNAAAAGNAQFQQNFIIPVLPHNHTQQFVGIPLQAATCAAAGSDPNQRLDHYNLYNTIDRQPTVAHEVTRAQQQGLSLSLSSQQQTGHGGANSGQILISPTSGGSSEEVIRVVSVGNSSSSSSGISNRVQNVLLSSKYLKAAQELLDEVVNVGNDHEGGGGKGANSVEGKVAGGHEAIVSSVVAGEGLSSGGGGESSGKRGSELTTAPAERQEIQIKKAKLVNMLDEVL